MRIRFSANFEIAGALAIALFLLAAIPANGQSRAGAGAHVEQLWDAAQQAQQAHEYARAIELYKQVLTLEPGLIEAEVNLGLMYQVNGDLKQAIQSFTHVLKRKPDLFPPNLLLGLDYLKLAKPELALYYLDQAVRLKPDDIKAQLGDANANLELQRYARARDGFERITETDHSNAEAWYGLGASYLSMEKRAESFLPRNSTAYRELLLAESEMQAGRNGHAIELINAALGQNAAIPCSRSLLGLAYLADKQLGPAGDQFRKDWNEQRDTGCLLGKIGIAAAAAAGGDSITAVEQLREAVEIDGPAVNAAWDSFSSYFVGAALEETAHAVIQTRAQSSRTESGGKAPQTLFQEGRYSACTASLMKGATELPPDSLQLLAECAFFAGQDALVRQATGALLKDQPNDAAALYWDTRSLERLGLLSLGTAEKINPQSVSLHMMFANLLRSKQNFALAEEEYRKAIALSPDFMNARLGLAHALFLDNHREESENELKPVLKADPGNGDANYLMGEILLAKRDFDGALPFLSAGLQVPAEQRPDVHAALSKVYEEKGDLTRAIAELKEGVDSDQDGSYHYRLARLLEKTGDHAAARKALQQSRQLRAQSNASNLEANQ